jgi:hypothetical protein
MLISFLWSIPPLMRRQLADFAKTKRRKGNWRISNVNGALGNLAWKRCVVLSTGDRLQ